MDSFREAASPSLRFPNAAVSIAAVEVMDSHELCLIACHLDGSVSAWAPRDPISPRMSRRSLNATCVASAPDSAPHRSLVWIGHAACEGEGEGKGAVRCYRAHADHIGGVRLDALCELRACLTAPPVAMECSGAALVALERGAAPYLHCWRGASISEQSPTAVAERVDFAGAASLGAAASLLLVGHSAWVGCGSGAIAIADVSGVSPPACRLRTAGACAVTALALLADAAQPRMVASGLANGDIVLWCARTAVALALAGNGAAHNGAVCAMVYLSWSQQLCSVSAAREVLLWDWLAPSAHASTIIRGSTGECPIVLAARGVSDLSVQAIPQRLYALNSLRLIACAAETGCVLRYSLCPGAKEETEGDDTRRSSTSTESEVKELREECRRWEELCTASEADRCALERRTADALRRQLAETHAAVTRAEELAAENATLTAQLEELQRGMQSARGSQTFINALSEAHSHEGVSAETSSSFKTARFENEKKKIKSKRISTDAGSTSTGYVVPDRNYFGSAATTGGTVPACVAEALRVQLALFESLLRSHHAVAAAAEDPLLLQSTNILTDVFLMMRDSLGVDTAASIVREALGADTLSLRERDVVCKLFWALCYRYRTALAEAALPPMREERYCR